MAEKFDTSWFDLKNYDKLNELDFAGWVTQIVRRHTFNIIIELDKKYPGMGTNPIEYIKHIILNDPTSIPTSTKDSDDICRDPGDYRNYVSMFPFNTHSVCGTPVLQHFHIANDPRLSSLIETVDVADLLFEDEVAAPGQKPISFFSEEKAGVPADMLFKELDCYDHETTTHVTVNLAASDEQIMSDFRHWLTEYRKFIDYDSTKKNFTQADFDYWIKYGVIPYLDLVLIAKIEGKKITQNKLARLIFPDEYDVGIEGRLRQVTKPEAERLIKNEVYEALLAQLEHEKNGMKTPKNHPDT